MAGKVFPEAGGRAGEHGLGPRRGRCHAEHAGAPRPGGIDGLLGGLDLARGCAGRAPRPSPRARSDARRAAGARTTGRRERCSSRAMSRVSVGWVTFERFRGRTDRARLGDGKEPEQVRSSLEHGVVPRVSGRPAACSLPHTCGGAPAAFKPSPGAGPARLRRWGRNRGFPPRRALRHTRCVWILPQTAFSFCTSCR